MNSLSSAKKLKSKRLKIQNSKILCIGDIILDKYVKGKANRISPEAPVPIIKVENESFEMGGAANVARNITGLGGRVILIGLNGSDMSSKIVKSLISNNKKIASDFIKIKNYITPLKTRIISSSTQLIRVDEEDNFFKINKHNEKLIIKKVRKHIKKVKTIIISDYNKGLLTEKLIEKILDIADSHNVDTLIDPKKHIKYYKGANVITPNIKEFQDLFIESKKTNSKNIIYEARNIIKKYKIREILITMSEKGMLYISPKTSKKFKALSKEIYDVTGAGDTVIATLAIMNNIGMKTVDSADIANVAASIVVCKPGTTIITLEELLKELR
tara:strand:+ start:3217 stop:4203 length:987 start_codon:yes stop_codon:yes gene_type:complete